MARVQTITPLDAMAKPEYKRYIFEGNFPYRKWAKLLTALSLLVGFILVAASLAVLVSTSHIGLQNAAEYIAEFGAALVSLGILLLLVLVASYFFPTAAWSLFSSETPKEAKKLGIRLARSWEKHAPKYFKGFEDPIRKNIYYPGLNSISPRGNQLVLVVILPNGVVSGGVSEYCNAAALEMQDRLEIPVQSVAFGHHEYVDTSGRKTKPDLNTATFVLTPKDYSLRTRRGR